jgi:hypothetical protein
MTTVKNSKLHQSFFSAKVFLWLMLGLSLSIFTSCGGEPELQIGASPTDQAQQVSFNSDPFQIGSTWGAEEVTSNFLNTENSFEITRAAVNTVYIRTLFAKGTGFFLGEHNGDMLVATNAHVLKNIPSCTVSPVIIDFNSINLTYTCSKVIGIWRSIDFAIISLNTNPTSHRALSRIEPLQFDFKADILKNNLLMTIGHGDKNSSGSKLTLKRDEDCRVYSPSEQFKRLKNPVEKDALSVLSFAMGCDIAPGDSGSPVMDRKTGKVLGIAWSTYSPKPAIVRSQAYMERLREQESEDVWEYLSYAVPASEIRQELIRWTYQVQRSRIMAKRRETILRLLNIDP